MGITPPAPRLSRETRQGLTPMCYLSRGPMGRTPAEGVGTSSQPLEASSLSVPARRAQRAVDGTGRTASTDHHDRRRNTPQPAGPHRMHTAQRPSSTPRTASVRTRRSRHWHQRPRARHRRSPRRRPESSNRGSRSSSTLRSRQPSVSPSPCHPPDSGLSCNRRQRDVHRALANPAAAIGRERSLQRTVGLRGVGGHRTRRVEGEGPGRQRAIPPPVVGP